MSTTDLENRLASVEQALTSATNIDLSVYDRTLQPQPQLGPEQQSVVGAPAGTETLSLPIEAGNWSTLNDYLATILTTAAPATRWQSGRYYFTPFAGGLTTNVLSPVRKSAIREERSMADKKDEPKKEEKEPKKPDLENRLSTVEYALSSGMNVDLSAYDPVAIQEAREQALAEAEAKSQAAIAEAFEDVKAVKLTDAERIERLERAVQGALGRSL